jgi:hypothetical protein
LEPAIAKKSWQPRFCYRRSNRIAFVSPSAISVPGTNAASAGFPDMGPREEDNDMLLLAVVSVICASLVGILEIGQTRPAAAAKPTIFASDQPVRVILPFTPNTTPSQR